MVDLKPAEQERARQAQPGEHGRAHPCKPELQRRRRRPCRAECALRLWDREKRHSATRIPHTHGTIPAILIGVIAITAIATTTHACQCQHRPKAAPYTLGSGLRRGYGGSNMIGSTRTALASPASGSALCGRVGPATKHAQPARTHHERQAWAGAQGGGAASGPRAAHRHRQQAAGSGQAGRPGRQARQAGQAGRQAGQQAGRQRRRQAGGQQKSGVCAPECGGLGAEGAQVLEGGVVVVEVVSRPVSEVYGPAFIRRPTMKGTLLRRVLDNLNTADIDKAEGGGSTLAGRVHSGGQCGPVPIELREVIKRPGG